MLLTLAALWHDVGKFSQRARWGERRRHEEWGAEWLEKRLLPRLGFLTEEGRRRVATLIRRHHEHRPYERDLRALQLADRLSSGERMEREGEETGDPARDRLIPVFVRVRLPERLPVSLEANPPTYRVAPFRLDDVVFPEPPVPSLERPSAEPGYPGLWQEFEAAWQAFPADAPTFAEPEAFVMTSLSLLRAYAWCVPSAAYRSEPDVSLADHLQVTAALALCLWPLSDEALSRLEEDPFASVEVACLVGGDVTGIQRFLYTISSRGAAKSLRGRSAYLGLLCDAAAEFVRRSLELPPCNLLYSTGGHFYLLAPLVSSDRLAKVREELLETLLAYLGGDVALVLEAVSLCGADFRIAPKERESPLAARWAELATRLRERKDALLREQAVAFPEKVFGPFGAGGTEFCVVCHAERNEPEELHRLRLRRPLEPEPGEEGGKCSLCRSFEDLARDIARAEYLLLRPAARPPEGTLAWHSVLQALSAEMWLGDRKLVLERYRPGDWVLRLNEADLRPVRGNGRAVPVVGFRFLPCFSPFENEGAIRDMEKLAGDSVGVDCYGALRMDVDNLGRVFAEGLGGAASLSRMMTLSRMLALFFEGYLNVLCRKADPAGRHLYLLYAGGDDLFAVGSWDRILKLAALVREEFRRYTCWNPSLTVSAGASLHHPKYPLYQAAADAKAFLEAAKKSRHPDGHEKDAFGFWGRTVDWDRTYPWLEAWHRRLWEWLAEGRIRRAFLFKLGEIAELHRARERKFSQPFCLSGVELHCLAQHDRWLWKLYYYAAKEEPAVDELLQELQAGRIDCLQLLVRWVELSARGA